MNEISIDLETFSSVSLKDCGVYRYIESPDFEILLFGFSVDNGPVTVIDMAAGETIPQEILDALTDDSILKWAFNAQFERLCLSAYLGIKYLSPVSWRCSMIWASYRGLPLSLEMVGSVLNLSEQKLDEGKALIKYFSVPCTPTKANGQRTRNYYYHDPEKWQRFKEYNKRDVEVELAIKEKLKNFPVPQVIWDEWTLLDQPINDRGILIDMEMVENAITIDDKTKAALMDRLKAITGLENPNSPLQMRAWLRDNGIETDSLDKKTVAELLKTASDDAKEVLLLRQQIAKSSVKKYTAMENLRCEDGRAHGCFQFGGTKTFRWAGRHIQLQNLPQNHMPDLEQARSLVKAGNYDALTLLYDNIPAVLSELIRTAFVPPEGMKYIVADFAQIEARVLAFLAGETWRIELFKDPKADLYCASGTKMFGVKVEKHGENAHLRQKSKAAELGLGYGGGRGALLNIGALDYGLKEDELDLLVQVWRKSNPHIVSYWWDVDRAVKKAVAERTSTRVGNITFTYKSGMLFIGLPSGREITYVKPHIGVNQYGSESVIYWGQDSTKHWSKVEIWGPKVVENLVQSLSRDLLVNGMKNLSDCRIVAHVHDELILEAPMDMELSEVCEKMAKVPEWMRGLPLRADGYECQFYQKD